MRVKRYIVEALPEAVSLIRTELGKDAIILETKEIKVGGFMGMFRKRKMEVIAAVETNAAKAPEPPLRKPAPEVAAMVEQILQTAQRSSTAVAEPPKPAPPEPEKPVEKRGSQEQFIIEEIRELRSFMVKMSKERSDLHAMSPPLLALKQRLLKQEVDEELAGKLIDWLQEQQALSSGELEAETVWSLAASKLEEWLEPFNHGRIDPSARVVHFVGPTGVGKTTTIAKLAAEQTIKLGKKVGFITSDTYRIAAVDQLRTYANILNVPMEVVFSPMDLPKAYRQLAERDLILMDTAGRNFRSELHVSEVNSLLQSDQPGETVLVLSMTGKTADMVAIAERFIQYGVQKVLFTKLDETEVYGAILNLILQFELQPTHLASGQTVPDDIAPFQAGSYIAMLLGEARNE
jgi:flagellar biosynthesis protein FlhF